MTTKELVEAVARASEHEPFGHATGAAVDTLATNALALEAELAEWRALDARYSGGVVGYIAAVEQSQRDALSREIDAAERRDEEDVETKARALEEAAEEHDDPDTRTWLRSRAADVRAGR